MACGDEALLNFTSMELEELNAFAGAPPMPRLDGGDAFDNILQRWLAPNMGQYIDIQGPGTYSQQQPPQIPQQYTQQPPQIPQQYTVHPSAHLPGHSAPHGLPYEAQQMIQPQQFNPMTFGRSETLHIPPEGYQPSQGYQSLDHTTQFTQLPLGPRDPDFNGNLQPVIAPAGVWDPPGRKLAKTKPSGSRANATPSPVASQGLSDSAHRDSPQAQSAQQSTETMSGMRSGGTPTSSRPTNPNPSPVSQTIISAMSGPTQDATMPAIGPSIAEAQAAWPKRKRGAMTEASKEKERARNRRAQKRFREREKEKQEQRQGVMSQLETALQAIKQEKEDLQQRNAALEHAMRLKQQQAEYDSKPPEFDGLCYVESIVDDFSELLPEISLGEAGEQLANPRQLTQEEAATITFKQHAVLYRGYVDALKALLRERGTPGSSERMAKIVRELCSLNLAIAFHQPKEYSVFHTSRLDGSAPAPAEPPADVWRKCLAALELSEEQKAGLLAERRSYLSRLSPLLKQRWELHRIMLAAFPDTRQPGRGSQAKALEAVEKLKENLRQEQTLLIQSMCQVHQAILAPEQTAANIVTAFPYYPDVPMLVDLIAADTPGERTTAAILDVEGLPPL